MAQRTVIAACLLSLLGPLVSACPYPTAVPCVPGEDDCPDDAFCHPEREICMLIPDGGLPPSADAAADAGVIELDATGLDVSGRDLVQGDTAGRDIGLADLTSVELVGADTIGTDATGRDLLASFDGDVLDAPRPDQTGADQGAADSAVPDVSGLDTQPADAALPDTSASDTSASDTSAPDTSGLDTSAPDTSAPDTSAPDTSALDTSAPDTSALDTSAPDTSVPDTSAPDTSAPDTSAPDISQADACAPPAGPPWWNLGYAYRFPLDVAAAPADYTITISLSGADAAAVYNSSLASGDDLRLVQHSFGATQIDREVLQLSAASVVIRFKIQEVGGYPGGPGTYFLYAGNATPAAPMQNLRGVYLFFEDFEGFAVGADGSPTFTPRPADAWRVVDDSGNKVYHLNGLTRPSAEIVGQIPADAAIEASVKYVANISHDYAGFAYRASILDTTTLNCYAAALRGLSDEAGIASFASGGFAWLDVSSNPWSLDTWYAIEAVFYGGHSHFVFNGIQRGSIETTSTASQLLALLGHNVSVYFDDVKLRLAQSAEPAVALGAGQQPCR